MSRGNKGNQRQNTHRDFSLKNRQIVVWGVRGDGVHLFPEGRGSSGRSIMCFHANLPHVCPTPRWPRNDAGFVRLQHAHHGTKTIRRKVYNRVGTHQSYRRSIQITEKIGEECRMYVCSPELCWTTSTVAEQMLKGGTRRPSGLVGKLHIC